MALARHLQVEKAVLSHRTSHQGYGSFFGDPHQYLSPLELCSAPMILDSEQKLRTVSRWLMQKYTAL